MLGKGFTEMMMDVEVIVALSKHSRHDGLEEVRNPGRIYPRAESIISEAKTVVDHHWLTLNIIRKAVVSRQTLSKGFA
jgi:hypothetical protein